MKATFMVCLMSLLMGRSVDSSADLLSGGDCSLTPGSECNSSDGPCCQKSCKFSPIRIEKDCWDNICTYGSCSGNSSQCPPKGMGTPCKGCPGPERCHCDGKGSCLSIAYQAKGSRRSLFSGDGDRDRPRNSADAFILMLFIFLFIFLPCICCCVILGSRANDEPELIYYRTCHSPYHNHNHSQVYSQGSHNPVVVYSKSNPGVYEQQPPPPSGIPPGYYLAPIPTQPDGTPSPSGQPVTSSQPHPNNSLPSVGSAPISPSHSHPVDYQIKSNLNK